MKELTFDEWVKRYVDKTGDKVYIPDGFQLAFDEEHGFFVFGFVEWNSKAWLQFGATCVNSWKWMFGCVIETVIDNGLAGCLTLTKKNPKAYTRLTGAKHQGTDNEGYHIFTWEVQDVQF